MEAMEIALKALLVIVAILLACGVISIVNGIAPGGRKFSMRPVLIGGSLILAALVLPRLLLG